MRKLDDLTCYQPIKFHDFSADKSKNYSGYGIKSIYNIREKDDVMMMSLDMGLVSNVLVDSFDDVEKNSDEQPDEDDLLLK